MHPLKKNVEFSPQNQGQTIRQITLLSDYRALQFLIVSKNLQVDDVFNFVVAHILYQRQNFFDVVIGF